MKPSMTTAKSLRKLTPKKTSIYTQSKFMHLKALQESLAQELSLTLPAVLKKPAARTT